MSSQVRGQDAEDFALSFLQERKLQAVSRNFRSRFGEIDLIMHDGNNLIFIEVRHRQNTAFGTAEESITRKKREKITATALYFLQKNPRWQKNPSRFDVIAISGKLVAANVNWVKGAFDGGEN